MEETEQVLRNGGCLLSDFSTILLFGVLFLFSGGIYVIRRRGGTQNVGAVSLCSIGVVSLYSIGVVSLYSKRCRKLV